MAYWDKKNKGEGPDDDLKDLVEQEVLTSGLRTLCGAFIALALLIGFHAVYGIYNMLTDKSVPLVVCPRAFDLDAPVLMKTIKDTGPVAQDRWIRGFMRRYITSQFPRVPADVEPFFSYVSKHSTGYVKNRYEALLRDREDISSMVGAGWFYQVYPKASSELKISTIQGYNNRWQVELDTYMIKNMTLSKERFTPTLRYTVQAGDPTIDNPEGLYVIETDVEQITDYVSGNKESL